MSGLINLNPFITCLGSAYSQTVPPDVLLVNPVIAQETATELSGWLGHVVVQGYYTTPSNELSIEYYCATAGPVEVELSGVPFQNQPGEFPSP